MPATNVARKIKTTSYFTFCFSFDVGYLLSISITFITFSLEICRFCTKTSSRSAQMSQQLILEGYI